MIVLFINRLSVICIHTGFHVFFDRQESLRTDLAQVQEEYAMNKENSKKTIQVGYCVP